MRQYFTGQISDSLIVPQSAVSPATTPTFIFSQNQALKYLALPYGQNAPSPGQVFYIIAGGLCTTPASGTLIFSVYHGAGSTATTGGTLIATSQTLTAPVSVTAGYWQLQGTLVYRAISETATTSTCWFNGLVVVGGPSGGTIAPVSYLLSSNAAVSVDTTGNTSGGFGALNLFVTHSVTGSTWTPEFSSVLGMN